MLEREKEMERWREARRKDSFARKKKFLLGLLLLLLLLEAYEVVPKKVNGADFEEEREPLRAVTMQIRGNWHRTINHATRVHARFDDEFK